MKCVACGTELKYEIVELEVATNGEMVAIAQPGWYCWACNTGKHSAGDLWVAERAFRLDKPDP